jgi:hypothetical protein
MSRAENSHVPEGGASTGSTNLTPTALPRRMVPTVMVPAPAPPTRAALYCIKAGIKFQERLAKYTIKPFCKSTLECAQRNINTKDRGWRTIKRKRAFQVISFLCYAFVSTFCMHYFASFAQVIERVGIQKADGGWWDADPRVGNRKLRVASRSDERAGR